MQQVLDQCRLLSWLSTAAATNKSVSPALAKLTGPVLRGGRCEGGGTGWGKGVPMGEVAQGGGGGLMAASKPLSPGQAAVAHWTCAC